MIYFNKKVVCILDFNWRSFWIVNKEISKYYDKVIVITWDDILFSTKKFNFYSIGNRNQKLSIQIEKIEKILAQYEDIDLFPISDFSSVISYELNKNKYNKLIGPSQKDYLKVSSKINTSVIALNSGFKVAEITNVDDFNQNYNYFLRPEYSVFKLGSTLTKTKNYTIKNIFDLNNAIHDLPKSNKFILQRSISGKGLGVNVYAKDGEIELMYGTIRLTQPINGGASSKRGPYQIDKSLNNKITLFVKELNFSGIMMIELMIIKNDFYFIECNARPWGSISVPHVNGYYFCSSLVKEKNIYSHTNNDIKLRHLGKDYFLLREKLSRSLMKSLIHFYNLISDVFSKKVKFDEFKFDYWFFELTSFLKDKMKIIQFKKMFFSQLTWNKLPVLNDLEFQKKKVLYICKGNINRSMLAEIVSKENFFEGEFKSCGFVNRVGRSISFNMSKTCMKYKLPNSDNFFSKNIAEYNLTYFDYLVVFDKKIMNSLIKYNGMKKIVRFSKSEIIDPYGNDLDFFDKTFVQIKTVLGVNK